MPYHHSQVKFTVKLIKIQGFPWQPGIQPVSRGWIGLGTEVHRGDTPIHQVIKSLPEKQTNYKLLCSLRPCFLPLLVQ